MARPPTVEAALPSGRQPTSRPVTQTKKVQSIAVNRSVTDRPTSTAGRHIGSERKRSMMPPFRSLLSPTAVPMAEVVRLKASIPAMAKLA